jgi:hypothetical protein
VTTATELVTAALGKILVRSADSPLEADELQDGIADLNRMMASWDITVLTYTVVTSGSDDLTVPAYAEDAMVFGLALRSASDYGVVLSAAFAESARESKANMLRKAVTIGRAKFPSTLPRGSGNTNHFLDYEFYPPSTGEITP